MQSTGQGATAQFAAGAFARRSPYAACGGADDRVHRTRRQTLGAADADRDSSITATRGGASTPWTGLTAPGWTRRATRPSAAAVAAPPGGHWSIGASPLAMAARHTEDSPDSRSVCTVFAAVRMIAPDRRAPWPRFMSLDSHAGARPRLGQTAGTCPCHRRRRRAPSLATRRSASCGVEVRDDDDMPADERSPARRRTGCRRTLRAPCRVRPVEAHLSSLSAPSTCSAAITRATRRSMRRNRRP